MSGSAGGTVGAVEALDPVADPRWSDLFGRATQATAFHHPAWLGLLARQYGYGISAWSLADADGRLVTGLPVALVRSGLTGTRLVALPFSDACPPLRDAHGQPDSEAFAAAVAGERSRSGLDLEVRASLPAAGAHVVTPYVEHILALGSDPDTVAAGFSKSQVRRAISKARREGVEVEQRTDADALERFYRLHVRTRRRQGVPTQPKRFILRFVELFESGLGFVLLARHGGEDAAAAVFLAAGSTLTYKYGASDPDHLPARPNHLIFAEAIRWGCEQGYRRLDFGRTDLDNEGLRRFKAAWGAEERPLSYTHFGAKPPDLAPGIPQRVLAATIRRAPPTFGRFVGEALYRHFG